MIKVNNKSKKQQQRKHKTKHELETKAWALKSQIVLQF